MGKASTPCRVDRVEIGGRVAVRASSEGAAVLGGTLGIALPRSIGQSTRVGERAALCLGPDEWLVIDAVKRPELGEMSDSRHGSLVDVSDRNVALTVVGTAASDVLERGCPRDLSREAFPVEACARTILGKAEIVIWRREEDAFYLECWRSFLPYVSAFLTEAMRDERQGSVAA